MDWEEVLTGWGLVTLVVVHVVLRIKTWRHNNKVRRIRSVVWR